MSSSSSSNSIKLPIFLILPSLFFAAFGEVIICENMPAKMCAFSISGKGKRCLLETDNGTGEFHCRTSEIDVYEFANHVETDECIAACGVDRKTIGVSSEPFKEAWFGTKLCSSACYDFCPNIVDFYFDHLAGEGAFLPDLCDAQRANPDRPMLEILGIGVGSGPSSAQRPALDPDFVGLASVAKCDISLSFSY